MDTLLNLLEDTTSFINWNNTVDGWIVNWFDSGFGMGGNMQMVGNIILTILSLFIATIFGGLIGYQREINGHSAGFRTHILIALGSALIMIISIYGVGGTTTRDPMRFAAAGVTGMGFLGAGSIIQNGFNVKGLTTAASMWVTMAIGMCCGCGYFVIGSITTLITLLCLSSFVKLERIASKKNTNVLLVINEDTPVLAKVMDTADKMGISVKDISSSIVRKDGVNYLRVVFKIACLDSEKVDNYLNELRISLNPLELTILV